MPIPGCCVDPLRAQLALAQQVWESDQKKSPMIGVSLPHQLARKYPRAPFLWQWFWVFPAANHCAHPRTGEIVRYHILHDLLQRAVRLAAQQTGVEGLITPHVLRHAYATHSRESLDSLRELMGHASIVTTSGYMHPNVVKATNPLDDLLKG